MSKRDGNEEKNQPKFFSDADEQLAETGIIPDLAVLMTVQLQLLLNQVKE